ncbi:9749_t:CDS:2, partial [Racocetra persica]
LQQFKKLGDYLGLPLIPSPSGGRQIQHRRIRGKEAINGSNLYYCSKSTNYNKERCGEPRGKGQGVVHPLSKDRLPELTEEFLKRWKKWKREQDKKPPRKRRGFRFITPETKKGAYAKIYARFGFHFTNQLPEKKQDRSIVRDSRNDLTDTRLSILGIRQLSEQKKKQLLVQFLKSDGSSFNFKLLQLSLDFHLQRWKFFEEDKLKPTQPLKLPTIPQRKEELENGTYQQIILTDENEQDYSVLFNPESKGIKEYFLDENIGNRPNIYLLKSGNIGICLNFYEVVIEMGNIYYLGCDCNADLQLFRESLVVFAENKGIKVKFCNVGYVAACWGSVNKELTQLGYRNQEEQKLGRKLEEDE